MLVKLNYASVFCVDLLAGTHITINDHFLMEFDISKNCFGIVQAGELRNLNTILGLIKCSGLCGHVKSSVNLKSALRPWCTGFHDSKTVFEMLNTISKLVIHSEKVCPPIVPLQNHSNISWYFRKINDNALET